MNNKLKPCPFCGGKARLKTIGDGYFVDCALEKGFCAVIPCTWDYETAEVAIEAWNRRAGEQND